MHVWNKRTTIESHCHRAAILESKLWSIACPINESISLKDRHQMTVFSHFRNVQWSLMICSKSIQQKQNQKQQQINKKAISYSSNEVKPPCALWLSVNTTTIKTALNDLLLEVSWFKKDHKVRHRLNNPKTKQKNPNKTTIKNPQTDTYWWVAWGATAPWHETCPDKADGLPFHHLAMKMANRRLNNPTNSRFNVLSMQKVRTVRFCLS